MRYLVLLFVLTLVPMLAGCPSITMSPEQLKASDGMATCSQLSSMYGKGSSITINPDNWRKGVAGTNDVSITCGDAQLTIKATATPPVPAK